MEVDGMYENTPWERLSLAAPWFGLAALLVAIGLYMLMRSRTDTNAMAARHIIMWLGPSAASLATLGALFTILWRPAHDTYPHMFGRAALWTGGGALVLGLIAAATRIIPWRAALLYALPTAAACGAAAISAFSHAIIAEGQVTGMVVPVSFVFALVIAVIVAAIWYRDPVQRLFALTVSFLALATLAAWQLPVVQFRDGGASLEMYSTIGGLYALLAGILAGITPRLGNIWWLIPGTILAGAVGYAAQSWFGLALTALGIAIAIGIGEPSLDENFDDTLDRI